jgi:hypothetical protein
MFCSELLSLSEKTKLLSLILAPSSVIKFHHFITCTFLQKTDVVKVHRITFLTTIQERHHVYRNRVALVFLENVIELYYLRHHSLRYSAFHNARPPDCESRFGFLNTQGLKSVLHSWDERRNVGFARRVKTTS